MCIRDRFNTVAYLLGMHEKSYFLNLGIKGYRLNNYQADYEQFKDIYEVPLGNPIGKRYFQDGLWKRDFDHGYVVLDIDNKTGEIHLSDGKIFS